MNGRIAEGVGVPRIPRLVEFDLAFTDSLDVAGALHALHFISAFVRNPFVDDRSAFADVIFQHFGRIFGWATNRAKRQYIWRAVVQGARMEECPYLLRLDLCCPHGGARLRRGVN